MNKLKTTFFAAAAIVAAAALPAQSQQLPRPPYLQPPPPLPGTLPGPHGGAPAAGTVCVLPAPGYIKTEEEQAEVSSKALAELTNAVRTAPTTKARIYDDMRSKPGNLELSARLLGDISALEVQNHSWQLAKQHGWSDDKFAQWQANNWNATDPATGGRFDPRVFWLAAHAPGEQADYLKTMSPQTKAQFAKNLDFAENQGWIKQDPNTHAWMAVQP